jgi:hypothetical protein
MKKLLLFAALVGAGCALQRNVGEESLPAAVRAAAFDGVWIAKTPTGGHGSAFPVYAERMLDGPAGWRVVFLTASHVAAHSPLTLCWSGAAGAPAWKPKAVYRHATRDLAALVVYMDAPPVLLRLAEKWPEFGDAVYVVGFPMEEVRRITSGWHGDTVGAIACDSTFGNSGGPVLNARGEVLGVLVSGIVLPGPGSLDHMTRYEPIDPQWLNAPPVRWTPVTRVAESG